MDNRTVLYHRDGRSVVVTTDAEAEALGPGWADSPAGPKNESGERSWPEESVAASEGSEEADSEAAETKNKGRRRGK